jgi:hypothetical protein
MKTILFTKTVAPTFNVQVKVDIEDSITKMEEPGFERMMTIMETEGLTESAISQGLDLQLKEGSFQALIAKAKAVPVDSIKILDYVSSDSIDVYSRLVIVATDDAVGGVNGTTGEDDVLNVLDNDTLDGDPVDTDTVSVVEVSNNSEEAITLNEDGSIDVAAATDAGEYTIVYKICEIANPANCDTATAVITVVNP